jgi:DNA-binding YbaB/EbfC family protein
MLGGLGDIAKMGALLKQAMELKGRMEEAKAELAKMEIEVSVGAAPEIVTVRMNGGMEVVSLKISPELIALGPEMVESMTQAAVNKAVQTVQSRITEKLGPITSELNIPGLT